MSFVGAGEYGKFPYGYVGVSGGCCTFAENIRHYDGISAETSESFSGTGAELVDCLFLDEAR